MRYSNLIISVKMENKSTVESPRILITLFSNQRLTRALEEAMLKKIEYSFKFYEETREYLAGELNQKLVYRCLLENTSFDIL